LLRGMGWKDTETLSGSQEQHALKPRILERRPALLGFGATPASAVGIELGEWGKSARGKNAKQESYNPVVLRNKVTGETLTEEELKAKLEGQQNNELVIDDGEPSRTSEKVARKSRHDDEKYLDRRSGRDREDRTNAGRSDRGSLVNGRQRSDRDGHDRNERSRRYASSSEDERRRKRDDHNKYHRRQRDRSTSGGAKYIKPGKYDENRTDKSRHFKDKDRSRHDYRRYEQEDVRRDRSERDYERDTNRRRR